MRRGRRGSKKDRSRADDWRAPFAHHREEDGGGEEYEGELVASHGFDYCTRELVRAAGTKP